jgi:hypothetical protein
VVQALKFIDATSSCPLIYVLSNKGWLYVLMNEVKVVELLLGNVFDLIVENGKVYVVGLGKNIGIEMQSRYIADKRRFEF